MEEWKNITIKHFEHFQVSNLGRVRNSLTGKIRSLNGDNGHGYVNITLKASPYQKKVYVHRLVAEAFLPDFREDLQVNHIDKNKRNNRVDNLEMVTDSENKVWSKEEYLEGHLKSQGKILQILDMDGNLLHEGLGLWETCRKYSFDPRSVQRVIQGKIKSHHGHKFRYKLA